jgi:hypothetical protein
LLKSSGASRSAAATWRPPNHTLIVDSFSKVLDQAEALIG